MTNEERLRWLAARFDMTSTARYEEDSERFYAETGYMAPGKDVPMAMGGQDEDERRHAHIAWVDAMAKSNQSAMLAGAEALRRIEAYDKAWDAYETSPHGGTFTAMMNARAEMFALLATETTR